ncbi:LysR family transcriptional regulator [Frigidibacter albus]|uniref:LysR family transcriptional regulator n=1 Tax=Frigidibacter albus TaxID=1465486 RepID=A0A6L8VHA0_9RHOB|nr:LysR substrate-binding domain-containing protein [Frigidibacter albus]MZQ89086.1 LysR family transcriptional regulator [Frigidibacter albus]NBE30857.1 LysR family transcriptional regulator [Frigidibacter albus]GGH51536.1 transcriptional regulator [Frigidibacter albus]
MRHAYTPTLPELQAFVQAAETGSTTRAAAALGLTQSAVSRSLNSLEARLGVRLFHRVRQRLILSDAGRAMLPEAGRILADLDAAALTVMSFGGHSEVLRIAALPTFGAVWLIPRLRRFAAGAPDVTFDMTATLEPVDFDRAPVDLAVLRGPPRPGLRTAVLVPERLVVVAAPRLLGEGPLEDADLARLPLLQQATRPNLWLDWFLDAGMDPITILRGARFEQFGMVLAAARAGMGAALVPEVLVGADLAGGALRLASRRSMPGRWPYALSWPERSEERASFRAFRDWLVTEAEG